jgi:hypothetical protein
MIRRPNDTYAEPWVRRTVFVTVAATVVASGYFVVRGLVDPGGLVPGGDTEAATTYATYLAARGVVLLGGLAWFAILRAWRPLALLLVLNGIVQAIDAIIGAVNGQVPETIGPAVFAAALVACAAALRRTVLWNVPTLQRS